jgi:hypothetical protein
VPICRDFPSAATRQEYQSCERVAKSAGNQGTCGEAARRESGSESERAIERHGKQRTAAACERDDVVERRLGVLYRAPLCTLERRPRHLGWQVAASEGKPGYQLTAWPFRFRRNRGRRCAGRRLDS